MRVARGLRLLRIVSTVNRGLKTLGRHMSRRGFAYVLSLSLVVTLAGSAGMYAFEHDPADPRQGLADYGSALWWTAMMVTTMGSDYWPRTPEGRVLCLLLALYSFAVFGYVTAALASFFVGRDAQDPPQPRHEDVRLDALQREVAALRADLGAGRRGATASGAGPSRRRASRPRRPR
jgi:voltage-gated potassium channel